MQMKNQRFLYPESAAERRQAEDDPLVRSDSVDDDGDGDGDDDGDGESLVDAKVQWQKQGQRLKLILSSSGASTRWLGEASRAKRESLLCQPQEQDYTMGRPKDTGIR